LAFGAAPVAEAKPAPLVVGVDIDGVLGDQITGLIPLIARDYGVSLTFDMIDDYRFAWGPVDIGSEIGKAQSNPDYVEKMPLFPGAREMLAELRRHHRVVIVTARSIETRESTRTWLARECLAHDELIFTDEADKSAHGLDVLIDDYVGNVVDFLDRTSGVAILVRRPWNRNDGALAPFLSCRTRVVTQLAEIAPALLGVSRR
jgi:uncharacterized HAD superfamily protein